jgi:hypothetical protein
MLLMKISEREAAVTNVAEATVEMLKDQGVLDEFLSNVRGAVHNPSLVVSFEDIKKTRFGLEGVNGDIELMTQGTGTQLPAGVRQSLIDVLAGLEGRTDAEANALRDQILAILGWNRVVSPHNPVPGPTPAPPVP